MINNGDIAIATGVSIRLDGGTLENTNSGTIDTLGDNVSFTPFKGGTILNSGTLVKSAGEGTAYINSSNSDIFVNKGYLTVVRLSQEWVSEIAGIRS